MHEKTDWDGSHHLQNTETLTESTVSRWTSSGIFSQDSIRCSSMKKSKVYCWDWMRHQRISQEESYLCRCSTTSPVDQETMKKNACQMPISFFCIQRDVEKDNGHSLVLVLKRSGTLSVKTVHKESGTKWRKGCHRNSQKVVVQFQCYTSPLSRGRLRSKGHGKLSIHSSADLETVETICRIIVSAHQLSICGAIAKICEE